jgi:hypothetical protein
LNQEGVRGATATVSGIFLTTGVDTPPPAAFFCLVRFAMGYYRYDYPLSASVEADFALALLPAAGAFPCAGWQRAP